jgi:uncharacterized protein YndB with AHSA1/START domain
MGTDTDRIEKKIHLRAPRARVFRALTDATEFGSWFRVNLEGPFRVGERVRGKILEPGFEHITMEVLVERIEPERAFAFRWHPGAIDPAVDYENEPMTLVEFLLEDAPDGTALTVVESGFDRIPAGRRSEAFRLNEGGWAEQVLRIQRHVER